MLFAVTGLQGCPVEASDGQVGSVKDFLFDDQSWQVRWMVVDSGHWLPGRQVLVHPSAIAPLDLALPVRRVLPMMSTGDTLVVSVRLTKQQIEAAPEAREDEPVTKQMESDLHDHYGWDPAWGTTYFGASDIAAPLLEPLIFSEAAARQAAAKESHRGEGDPHLQSVASVNGYSVRPVTRPGATVRPTRGIDRGLPFADHEIAPCTRHSRPDLNSEQRQNSRSGYVRQFGRRLQMAPKLARDNGLFSGFLVISTEWRSLLLHFR